MKFSKFLHPLLERVVAKPNRGIDKAMQYNATRDDFERAIGLYDALTKGAHIGRGGPLYKKSRDADKTDMSKSDILKELEKFGRQGKRNTSYQELAHIKDQIAFDPSIVNDIIEASPHKLQRPAYIIRTEDAYNTTYANDGENILKGKVLADKNLDETKKDRLVSAALTNPDNYTYSMPMTYRGNDIPMIYKLEPGDTVYPTAGNSGGAQLADTNEVVVKRGAIGEAMRRGHSATVEDYFNQLVKGNAPFAVAAAPIGGYYTAEELASQQPGMRAAPESPLFEFINRNLRDNPLLNMMFGGTSSALDKILQGNRLDFGDYAGAVMDFMPL